MQSHNSTLRPQLREALQVSRSLSHGWALAFIVAEEEGSADVPSSPLPEAPTSVLRERLAKMLAPYAHPLPKEQEGGILEPLNGKSSSDSSRATTAAALASMAIPQIFLRSNPSSKVLFAVHPILAYYSKLIADLVIMMGDGGMPGGDGEEERDDYNDSSTVNVKKLRPYNLSPIFAAANAMTTESARKAAILHAYKGGDNAAPLHTGKHFAVVVVDDAPSLPDDVALSSTLSPQHRRNRIDWQVFYGEHLEDMGKHLSEKRMGKGKEDACGETTIVRREGEEETEKEKGEGVKSGGGGGGHDNNSACNTNYLETNYFDMAEAFQHHVLKELIAASSSSPSSSAGATRPRPLVIDMLGFDNAVLALIAAYAHGLAMAHYDLAVRGALLSPLSVSDEAMMGIGDEEGVRRSAVDAFLSDVNSHTNPPPGEKAFPSDAREGASGSDASSNAVLAKLLAFTIPTKPPPSLLMDLFYGNALIEPIGGYSSAFRATMPETHKLPYWAYEAVTARQSLLPFMADYRRPFNFSIGSEARIVDMLEGRVGKEMAARRSALNATQCESYLENEILFDGALVTVVAEAAMAKASASISPSAPLCAPTPFSYRTMGFMIALASRTNATHTVPLSAQGFAQLPPIKLASPDIIALPDRATASALAAGATAMADTPLPSPPQTLSSGASTVAASSPPVSDRSQAGAFWDQQKKTTNACEKEANNSNGVVLTACPQSFVNPEDLADGAKALQMLKKIVFFEQYALVSAVSRTTSVMNAANFLQLQPLVELCGLSLAMILRGRTLDESRGLFRTATSYTVGAE